MAFAALKNDRFLRALRREPVDTTPIWVMRQAGRYLPEYRATRERAGSFLALAQNPELACEVTLQPLERFALDAAILFSDILTIPDAMGLGLSLRPRRGPAVRAPGTHAGRRRATRRARHGRRPALRDGCRAPDPPGAARPCAADRLLRQPVDAGLLHGRGRRFARFRHVEGACAGTSRNSRTSCSTRSRNPLPHYLMAQAAAGAQALMIFDTWGGLLGPAAFREFSLR